MALTKQVYNRTAKAKSVVLGILSDLIDLKKDKISFIPKNFDNPEVAVMLIIDYANGASDTVVCSHKLSAMVRDKTVTLANLLTLELHEFITDLGESMNILQLPLDESKRKISIDLTRIVPKPLVVATATVRTFQQSITLG